MREMPNLKVVVTGYYRTGTTQAYNMVRLLLGYAGVQHFVLGATGDLLVHAMRHPGKIVIKSHECYIPPRDQLYVVACVRDPVDTVGSNMTASKIGTEGLLVDQITAGINQGMAWAAEYAQRPDGLVLVYEELYDNPMEKARRIAEHLDLDLDKHQLRMAVDGSSLDTVRKVLEHVPPDRADIVTQLRHHHLEPNDGKPGTYALPAWLVKTIRVKCPYDIELFGGE